MQLDSREVNRFYKIWEPLISFVNRRLQIVPDLPATGPWEPHVVLPIRDALWADDSHLDAFVAENPAGLSAEDLAIAKSWHHRVAGEFYVLRHLQKYSVFIAGNQSAVYGVLGLRSPLSEMIPTVPWFVKVVLLPFGEQIVYDSLLNGYNIMFGRGIQRSLEQTYKDAKERAAIITSLLPLSTPPDPEQKQKSVSATNAQVLDAFRDYLYRSNLSTKVVERDVSNVTVFAEKFLAALPEPSSLRDFGSGELQDYFVQVGADRSIKETRRKEMLTSFKRFVKFLRDTERIDYDSADGVLETLREMKP